MIVQININDKWVDSADEDVIRIIHNDILYMINGEYEALHITQDKKDNSAMIVIPECSNKIKIN